MNITPLSNTSPEQERAARLADDNGFDGSLFRNLTKEYAIFSLRWIQQLKKEIETLPKIIAVIEKHPKAEQGWHIENGQVFYNGADLQFPSGQIQEIMEKLVGLRLWLKIRRSS